MRTSSFALIVLCSSMRLLMAQSASERNAITTVLALEHAWNQAEQRKDTRAMDAIFDNQLVYVDFEGKLQTKAEFLAHMKAAASQPQQEVTESMAGHVFGSVVIVTGLYITKGVEKGKPYVRRGRFVDTWTFKDGTWLCVASEATPTLH